MAKKRVVVVGAGPGGLTCGMILAHRGADVIFFEKQSAPGGRNRALKIDGYTFDTGPTFLMMKYVLEEMFAETGRKASDYLEFVRIDPLYRLQFPDRTLFPAAGSEAMKKQISDLFPGNEHGFTEFMRKEGARFEKLIPCLQKDYSSLRAFIDPIFLKAAPYLAAGRTLYQNLGTYFNHEQLKLAFTFQSKYLGMSPWEAPALFTILSYMEYQYGIYHVIGGLNRISAAMAGICAEEGATIHYDQEVTKILTDGNRVTGVALENGDHVAADDVVVNADFGYAATHLLPVDLLKKWAPGRLAKKKFSCATFMLYLGLNRRHDQINHHNIVFAGDYRRNVETMFKAHQMTDDFSFYLQNACVTDPSLAPPGQSTFYVLVPVPNNKSGIDWDTQRAAFRDKVIQKIIQTFDIPDLESHIQTERTVSPTDWETKDHVHLGAVFNLAHNMGQMLYFRPHNAFEELNGLYLVGGGTHPGSGLPTIYESGRISANIISDKFKLAYQKPSFDAAKILPDAS